MSAVRVTIAGLGVAMAAYGLEQFLALGPANLEATVVWLVGGVLVHDAVLAPLTVAAGLLLARLWPGRLPAAVVTGLVVVATVTLVAVPVLGRFGARADNTTLLDRNYLVGWLLLVTLTLGMAAAAALRSRPRRASSGRARTGGGSGGTSAGRR